LAQTELSELSGLAASTLSNNVLWGVNDGGHGGYLYAIDKHSGANLGKLQVSGVVNVDWEDLAAFSIDDQHWLLIADVGDNAAERQLAHLWLVAEPQADAQGHYASSVQPVADIAFRYPDGARDVESVDVDIDKRQIIIISKRDLRPRIYTLPLLTSNPTEVMEAQYLGEVIHLEQPGLTDRIRFGSQAQWRAQPTALSIQTHANGSHDILLLTYKQTYWFNKQSQQSWAEALASRPVILPIPELAQAEALTFDQDTHSYWLTSERLPTPLYQLPINKQ